MSNERRNAWVRFMAAAMEGHPGTEVDFNAVRADKALKEYDKRFPSDIQTLIKKEEPPKVEEPVELCICDHAHTCSGPDAENCQHKRVHSRKEFECIGDTCRVLKGVHTCCAPVPQGDNKALFICSLAFAGLCTSKRPCVYQSPHTHEDGDALPMFYCAACNTHVECFPAGPNTVSTVQAFVEAQKQGSLVLCDHAKGCPAEASSSMCKHVLPHSPVESCFHDHCGIRSEAVVCKPCNQQGENKV